MAACTATGTAAGRHTGETSGSTAAHATRRHALDVCDWRLRRDDGSSDCLAAAIVCERESPIALLALERSIVTKCGTEASGRSVRSLLSLKACRCG